MGGFRGKPLPDDFREVSVTLGRLALGARYGVGKDTITRWFKEIGGNPRSDPEARRREIPADFARIAPTMTLADMERRYKVGKRVLKRWLAEAKANPGKYGHAQPWTRRPAPEDLGRLAPTMTQRQLRIHYATSRPVLKRWLAELGVQTRGPGKFEKQSNPGGGMIFRGHPGFKVERLDLRPVSIYNEAADVIRRFVAVSRCDPKGVYDQHGAFWRVGQMIMSADEMLEKANWYRRKAA